MPPPRSRSSSCSARSKPRRRTSSTTSRGRSTRTIPGLTTTTNQAVDVYTTLDLHLQRVAQDAVRDGLTNVDELVSRKRRGRAEAALISVDPRTGEILAMVGGRSYNQSQYNRAVVSRRQPGSVFKPFVYLTAFEEAADSGHGDVTPASLVDDSPTTWEFDDQVWSPENYEDEYDGLITLRRALAQSRNIATIKVAETRRLRPRRRASGRSWASATRRKRIRRSRSASSRRRRSRSRRPTRSSRTWGRMRPLRHILRIDSGGAGRHREAEASRRDIARPDTTFLVTNMMRSVINEGTGAGVRSAGFTLDAAGKTGTTNDLRDAWFVGFTPTLLTVVWVGFDDNQPLGLSGAQAALPIWTRVHEPRARRHAGRPVRGARRHHLRRHRSRYRHARRPRLPAGAARGVPGRHRAAAGVRPAQVLESAEPLHGRPPGAHGPRPTDASRPTYNPQR